DQRTMRLRVAEMASYFGIQGWFHKDVKDLSGGQKQLLNLASVMAMQPSVLILDEPTSQLDPIAASNFLNTVRKINLELATTVILSEHRLEEVFPVADQVLVMDDGKVLSTGTPREVGEELSHQGGEMMAALPAPMRIYYSVRDFEPQDAPCPLTVREGASWLSDTYGTRAEDAPRLDDEEPFEEGGFAPAVQFKDVWFRYERDLPDVLRGMSFEVRPATLFAVVGGNGTGKSTMLRCLCGACRPYRGKIKVLGKRLKDYSAESLFHGGVAMLPQDPSNLFVKKTVREDLEEMLSEVEPEKRAARIDEVCETCGIEGLLDAHPLDLSGGEKQRAALAKVLLCEPKILLLDEPTKGIDGSFKRRLASMLARLKERGVTIIMVSHDVEFCASYADTVSMCFDGTLVTTNTPRRFFAQNSFYTTAANRMSRHLFQDAVTDEDVVSLCRRI
ncbi:MAG: ABC transporter ATP-binding protein, partial [Coriobacteriales bacterium]